MLNFAPTDEQEEIRRLARSLAADQLRTQGRSAEKKGNISPELAQTLAQTGLTTPFSENYGGSGLLEAITYALIAEELGFGDGALAMNVIGSLMGPIAVSLAGFESQQALYLPSFGDEREGHNARGSFAVAERTGGYNVDDISATLRADGTNYVLNGTKRDVIHGGQASPRVALVRMEGTSGVDGLCMVLLPQQARGLKMSADVQKLGLIAAPSVSYTFENLVIPTSAVLGEPGNSDAVRAAAFYGILRAGVACGMARASLEYATEYARGRIAFGRPIASYQGIAFMVAEMAMKLDAVRLLLWDTAADWDGQVENETVLRKAEAAQYQAVTLAKAATIDGVQILGGAGFIQDHPVEMWMRNAAAME